MGERKVQCHYYGPDFNPDKIPRQKRALNNRKNLTMMLPMSIRCTSCRSFTGKGTKFNSIREHVVEENYLGITIYRFYFKCKDCKSAITLKTDPQNDDYAVEFGATRNFEPWRARDEQVNKEKKRRIGEEMGDSMKSLENRTLDCKREMDVDACLYELKCMRSRRAVISPDAVMGDWEKSNLEKQRVFEAEDEALTKSVFERRGKGKVNAVVLRINDDYFSEDEDEWAVSGPSKRRNVLEDFPNDFSKTTSVLKSSLIRLVPGIKKSATHSVAKLSQSTIEITEKQDSKQTELIPDGGLQYLLGQYCSDDEDQ